MILECSSKGDKRFSAFYAKTSFFGYENSIETIYQLVKRDDNGNRVKKGARVSYMQIKDLKLDVKYLTPFYKMLWVKYLDNNPELVEYAKGFDEFNDKFRGRCINCQADVIRDYVKNGREYIMRDKDVVELCNIIRELNKRA